MCKTCVTCCQYVCYRADLKEDETKTDFRLKPKLLFLFPKNCVSFSFVSQMLFYQVKKTKTIDFFGSQSSVPLSGCNELILHR